MNNAFFPIAEAYFNACCITLSAQDFDDLLAPSVQLTHQTNEESPTYAEGKEKVSALFKRYIFDNTSDVNVGGFSLQKLFSGIQLELTVEENKKEEVIVEGNKKEERINRYLFKETTIFQFEQVGQQYKIRRIDTVVKRTPVRS